MAKKSENLKCPGCGFKLSITKHYDASYEWFECPGCEGCFTYDEVLEGGGKATQEQKPKKKHKASKKHAEETPPPPGRPPEIPVRDMIQIAADEIETIFQDTGRKLDRMNAEDKALQLVRVVKYEVKSKVRERSVPMQFCEEHAE